MVLSPSWIAPGGEVGFSSCGFRNWDVDHRRSFVYVHVADFVRYELFWARQKISGGCVWEAVARSGRSSKCIVIVAQVSCRCGSVEK